MGVVGDLGGGGVGIAHMHGAFNAHVGAEMNVTIDLQRIALKERGGALVKAMFEGRNIVGQWFSWAKPGRVEYPICGRVRVRRP